jgi:hypothetical protein
LAERRRRKISENWGLRLGTVLVWCAPFFGGKGLLKPDRTPTEIAFKTQPWAWLPEEALTTTN